MDWRWIVCSIWVAELVEPFAMQNGCLDQATEGREALDAGLCGAIAFERHRVKQTCGDRLDARQPGGHGRLTENIRDYALHGIRWS